MNPVTTNKYPLCIIVEQTKDVDVTISNLLEGRVPYEEGAENGANSSAEVLDQVQSKSLLLSFK